MRATFVKRIVLTTLGLAVSAPPAAAQVRIWDLFQDALSPSLCEVVNAGNAELVVIRATGQLAIVTGADVIIDGLLVDVNNDVTYFGQPVGGLSYETGGDGLRAVWWTSLTGRVVDVDGFTGEPSTTNLLPSDFVDAGCDACDFWDDPSACPAGDTNSDLTINICGTSVPLMLNLSLAGLVGLRLGTRRRSRRRADD